LNLSQAVVVYAYEVQMARRGEVKVPTQARADDAQLREVRRSMELGLAATGFLRAERDDRHALDELLGSLQRAQLTRKEAALWIAAWRVVAKAG
jgi:tRNA C32,U32 (ribose-2'-O)-methylase TrmJ